MKTYNKLIAFVAAFGLVGVSFAQDEAAGGNLTDNISISGFIDASYNSTENAGAETENIGVDEVEIDFLFGFGSVSAEVHLDSTGGDLGVEQAFASYDVGNGFSVAVGKYGSSLGLEREDPGGLYTYSRAYASAGHNLGNVDANAYEGIALSYSADDYSVRISFQDGENTDLDDDSLDTEISLSYTGIDNLALGGGVASGNGADTNDVTNIHATYSAGKALLGAEWIEVDGAADTEAWMILVDYDVSDKLGLAIRLSEEDVSGATAGDSEKFTIAPNYAITDDLGAILEYSDGELNGSARSQLQD
jgi:hypothetical protein